MDEKVQISKREFQTLKDEVEVLKESLGLLIDKEKLQDILSAMKRVESGEYLTKEEILSNV